MGRYFLIEALIFPNKQWLNKTYDINRIICLSYKSETIIKYVCFLQNTHDIIKRLPLWQYFQTIISHTCIINQTFDGFTSSCFIMFYWAEHCQCVHSSNVYLKYAVVFISSLNRCNMMQNDQLTINPYKSSWPFNNTNRFKKVKLSVYIDMRAFFTNM